MLQDQGNFDTRSMLYRVQDRSNTAPHWQKSALQSLKTAAMFYVIVSTPKAPQFPPQLQHVFSNLKFSKQKAQTTS
jgi:hypothetical protein